MDHMTTTTDTQQPNKSVFQVGGPDLFRKDRDPHGNCRQNKCQSQGN